MKCPGISKSYVDLIGEFVSDERICMFTLLVGENLPTGPTAKNIASNLKKKWRLDNKFLKIEINYTISEDEEEKGSWILFQFANDGSKSWW